jgi:hypothetical protein
MWWPRAESNRRGAATASLQYRRTTIDGGTQKIQKDIVAKRVLGLS